MKANSGCRSLAALRSVFQAEAGKAFDAMFGRDGQNGLVTFDERESRACEQTDRLSRWLMEHHVGLDEAGSAAVEGSCPLCGHPVRYESSEQAEQEVRELMTRRGKIAYRRAAMRCRRCRTIFFPAGRAVEAGDGGLQPGDRGQD